MILKVVHLLMLLKRKKMNIDPVYLQIQKNIGDKYQKLRDEVNKKEETEKENENEQQLFLIENIVVDGDELNFMKEVLIEVFKRKCHYTNVLTLLNLFQRGEELVSMTYKKREYIFSKKKSWLWYIR